MYFTTRCLSARFRCSLCRRKSSYCTGVHLDITRREFRVLGARGPCPDLPLDLDHPLVSELGRRLVRVGRVLGVEDNLHDPRPVPKVDEYKPAVVPPPVDPTGKGHIFAGIPGPELSAPDTL